MPSENPIAKHDPEPNTENKTAKESATAQNKIPDSPTPTKSNSEKTYSHCQITCKQERDWLDWLTTIAEFVGLILLGVYTGYTIKMYCANRNAADAARSAADTAVKQLALSQTSINATVAQFQLDQRAWVGIDNITVKVERGEGIVHIIAKNTGKTPAKNVRWTINNFSAPKDGPLTFRPVEQKYLNYFGDLPPGGEQSMLNVGQSITPSALTDLLDQGKIRYIYGTISYDDVFGGKRQTDYCAIFLPDITFTRGPLYCQTHNTSN